MAISVTDQPRAPFRLPLRALWAASTSAALFAAVKVEEKTRHFSPEQREARRDAYVRRWAESLLRVMQVDVQLVPPGRAPRDVMTKEARLVVSNHRSTLDILLVLDLFGGSLLARGDMATWPTFGRMAEVADTLFVDRADPSSGAGAVQRVRDRLRRGRTVTVFAEGTTFAGDEVRPFHAGAFVAGARERVPILPVGFAYAGTHAIYGDEPIGDHFGRLLRAESTRVAVAVGEPFASRGVPIAELRDRTHDEVQKLVHRAREVIGA
jgi:1-acyl-sn-glycerol-3-phosphate acyltransferase